MAYALDDDEDKAGQQPTGTTVGAPASTQVAQGQPATAGGGNAPTGNKFIGFDQYLAANQGSAQQTANQLGTTAEEKGQSAKGAIGQAQTAFREGVTRGQGGIYSAPRPTTSADALKLSQTIYTGPKELGDVAPAGLGKQTQDAESYVGALGSQAGREALLQQGVGRTAGTYSAGQSRMDAALAGGAPGAQERFAKLNEKYGNGALAKYLGSAQQSAQKIGTQAAAGVGEQASWYGNEAKRLKALEDEAAANAPPTPAQLQAATDARNTQLNVNYTANQTPGDERIRNVGDEQAAARYGDKVLNEWIAAGRPEFSGWIRSKKKGK